MLYSLRSCFAFKMIFECTKNDLLHNTMKINYDLAVNTADRFSEL